MTSVPDAAEPAGSHHPLRSSEPGPSVETARLGLVTVATTVVGAGALLAAGAAGHGALLTLTLVLSLVLAWSWPSISGTFTPQATSVVLALSAFAIVLSALRDDLRWVAAAVAFGIVLSFFAQLRRTTGRDGLVLSLLSAFGGLVLIASGTTAVIAGVSDRGRTVVVVAMVAVVAALLADLVGGAVRNAAVLAVVAVLLGAVAAVAVGLGLHGPGAATAALVGAGAGVVSWALRRVLATQPTIGTLQGQVGAGVASLLAVGAIINLATVIT
ncbi:MAG: hypothetical protein L0H96_20025 [Humibacillus sp.]|nr:hypothetical protein [Humibacillus sp.]MDN5779185.1 hypothetical protein [Humibacillus sp.]